MLKTTLATSCTLEAGYLFTSKTSFYFLSNNSIEINLVEAQEKEECALDQLDKCTPTETDSAQGKMVSLLQEKAIKILQRRR